MHCSLHSDRIRVLSQPHVYVSQGRIGRGVFASKVLKADSVVGLVEGRLIDDADFESDYGIDMGGDVTLEPHAPFRYLNHSCNPNCELVDAPPNSVALLQVVALREIAANEEITIDYGWPSELMTPCDCRSANCRGVIGATEQPLSEVVSKRYQALEVANEQTAE